MNLNPTTNSLRLLSVCAVSLVVGACAHRVTEREVAREQPIVQQAPVTSSQPERAVVMQPPPAPQEPMTLPPATSGYTWLPGHYTWRDGWHWEPGQWVVGNVRPMPAPYPEDPLSVAPPKGGAQWVPGYWDYDGRDWAWTSGHWESRHGPKGDGSTGASQIGVPSAER